MFFYFAGLAPELTIYRAPEGAFVINWQSHASGTADNGINIQKYAEFLAGQPQDIILQTAGPICGVDFVTEQVAVNRGTKIRYKWHGTAFWKAKAGDRIYFKSKGGLNGYFTYRPGFGVTAFSLGNRLYRYESGKPMLQDCQ